MELEEIAATRPLAQKFAVSKNGRYGNSLGKKYQTAKIWQELRPKKEQVIWHRLLWTPRAVPREVITAWMVTLNRLPTMDRMKEWGNELDGNVFSAKKLRKPETTCSMNVPSLARKASLQLCT